MGTSLNNCYNLVSSWAGSITVVKSRTTCTIHIRHGARKQENATVKLGEFEGEPRKQGHWYNLIRQVVHNLVSVCHKYVLRDGYVFDFFFVGYLPANVDF